MWLLLRMAALRVNSNSFSHSNFHEWPSAGGNPLNKALLVLVVRTYQCQPPDPGGLDKSHPVVSFTIANCELSQGGQKWVRGGRSGGGTAPDICWDCWRYLYDILEKLLPSAAIKSKRRHTRHLHGTWGGSVKDVNGSPAKAGPSNLAFYFKTSQWNNSPCSEIRKVRLTLKLRLCFF